MRVDTNLSQQILQPIKLHRFPTLLSLTPTSNFQLPPHYLFKLPPLETTRVQPVRLCTSSWIFFIIVITFTITIIIIIMQSGWLRVVKLKFSHSGQIGQAHENCRPRLCAGRKNLLQPLGYFHQAVVVYSSTRRDLLI